MLLVTVRHFYDNARKGNTATSPFHLMQFVQVLLVPTMRLDMNWKESVFKVQTVSLIYGLHMVSTGLTLEKQSCWLQCHWNRLQRPSKPEFIKHDNHEVGIKIVLTKTAVKSLVLKWYHVIAPSQWQSTCSHLLFKNMWQLINWPWQTCSSLPHFKQTIQLHHNGSFNCWIMAKP